jgi:GrpB-like predicted nucleotidyltransferase (UPF0157 family)
MSEPLSEEEILAATVGERRPHNGTIPLAPYDPAWPAAYEQLAALIREALGDEVLLLEHVGSTAVPGLAAKPIIDILLAVADSADEAAYVPPLEERGFVLRIREPNWHEHRMLMTPIAEGHLHVFTAGCEEIERMLRFRDRLRSHPEDRQLYEDAKKELAARTWKYVQNYADAKSAVVEGILARASGGQT